jgi:glucokinase
VRAPPIPRGTLRRVNDKTRRSRRRWLLGDIGGTYARLATWLPALGLIHPRRYRNDDFDSLEALLASYQNELERPCNRAALALALPVAGDELQFTNRAWRFSVAALRARLGLEELRCVNDFAAAAAGATTLAERDVETLQAGGGERPAIVLGPGTGLGTAAVLEAGPRATLVLPSEAGHMGCAPIDATSAALAAAAADLYGRASWERLLSGDGLAFIDARLRGADAPDAPAQVASRALAGDTAAQRAAREFARLLGAFAGDLVLAFGARGSVFLTGGVLEGLDRAFDAAAFLQAFSAKGRFGPALRAVAVYRVRAPDLAFRGLMRIAGGGIDVPGVRATA